MKKRIYLSVEKNKGSCKDPSFALKITMIAFLIFLTFPSVNSFEIENNESINLTGNINNLYLTSPSSYQDLLEMKTFQENTIYASSPLYFPEQTQILGAFSGEKENNQCQEDIISYKVKSGDSLSGIASKFGISVNTIVWANDLKNRTINTGQDLIILPVSGVFHMAAPGETVSSIAGKYKADKDEILSCNEIDKVMTGDILIVPGGEISTTVSRKPSVSSSPSPLPSSSSWLIPPTSGYISQTLHHYNAVDIANNCGTPIYASASGTIQRTGYHGTAGYYVRIIHSNGIVTFYGHLSEILVSSGQKVSQGNLIGRMGNTGYTIGPTGCHVHFEVRGGNNPFGRYSLNHRF